MRYPPLCSESFGQSSYVASLTPPTASDTPHDHHALARTAVNNAFWRTATTHPTRRIWSSRRIGPLTTTDRESCAEAAAEISRRFLKNLPQGTLKDIKFMDKALSRPVKVAFALLAVTAGV